MKFHKTGVAACIIEWCWWSKNENKMHTNWCVAEKRIFTTMKYTHYTVIFYLIRFTCGGSCTWLSTDQKFNHQLLIYLPKHIHFGNDTFDAPQFGYHGLGETNPHVYVLTTHVHTHTHACTYVCHHHLYTLQGCYKFVTTHDNVILWVCINDLEWECAKRSYQWKVVYKSNMTWSEDTNKGFSCQDVSICRTHLVHVYP